MLVPEFINAISMRFIMNRDIWLAREGRSGIYNWIAFSTAQVLSEIPYTITGRGIFYLLYYFMVGFPLGFAAGYSFLMFFMFFLFATSRGQWIAALRWVPTLEHSFVVRYSLTICQSSDSMVAATFMLFFIMCELYNDILRHHDQMPASGITPCTTRRRSPAGSSVYLQPYSEEHL